MDIIMVFVPEFRLDTAIVDPGQHLVGNISNVQRGNKVDVKAQGGGAFEDFLIRHEHINIPSEEDEAQSEVNEVVSAGEEGFIFSAFPSKPNKRRQHEQVNGNLEVDKVILISKVIFGIENVYHRVHKLQKIYELESNRDHYVILIS